MSTTRDSNALELAWCGGGTRRMMQDLEYLPAPLRAVVTTARLVGYAMLLGAWPAQHSSKGGRARKRIVVSDWGASGPLSSLVRFV